MLNDFYYDIVELLKSVVKHGKDIDDKVLNAPKLPIDEECEYLVQTVHLGERAKEILNNIDSEVVNND